MATGGDRSKQSGVTEEDKQHKASFGWWKVQRTLSSLSGFIYLLFLFSSTV